MINWKTTDEDARRIAEIAHRAHGIAARFSPEQRITVRELLMDVTACHLNGCPLDLAGLQTAGNGDFGRDVFGIRRHIDRSTGALGDCFVPRYAVKE